MTVEPDAYAVCPVEDSFHVSFPQVSHRRTVPGSKRAADPGGRRLAEITFTYVMPTIPVSECQLTYKVQADGSVQTTLSYDPVKELGGHAGIWCHVQVQCRL